MLRDRLQIREVDYRISETIQMKEQVSPQYSQKTASLPINSLSLLAFVIPNHNLVAITRNSRTGQKRS